MTQSRFDPLTPLSDQTAAPADCIWTLHPYPGPPPDAARTGSVPDRIVALGSLRGRPLAELFAVLGLPVADTRIDGGRLVRWIRFSSPKTGYHYTLLFDPYDLCIGLTYEWVA